MILKSTPLPGPLESASSVDIRDAPACRGNICGDQPPVLPRYVECVEIKEVPVPSLPRLQVFDDFSVGGGKQLYLFMSRVLAAHECRPSTTDGELRVFRVRESIALGQDVGKQIETASKGVDDQPGFNVHDGRERPNVHQFVDLLTTLRVQLLDDFVRGTFAPGFDAPFKDGELGVGPIYAGARGHEIIGH
jgi:hypothetical protein